MDKNLHKGHRQRVKQKFLKSGFEGFENHEILEMLLFYSHPRIDTNEIAHRLINQFGSISGVFNADYEALLEVDGIGESSAILLKMIPALTKEYLFSKADIHYLNSFESTCTFFKNLFICDRVEKVRAACLDDNLKVVAHSVISSGIPGSVSINIRALIEFTYRNKCDSVIIAHNHPNGRAFPSNNDLNSTTRVFNTLKSVGIKLLDHIIVAGNNAISLKETGAFSLL